MINTIYTIVNAVANNPNRNVAVSTLTTMIGEVLRRNATTPFQSKIGNGMRISGGVMLGITVVSLIAKRIFGQSGSTKKGGGERSDSTLTKKELSGLDLKQSEKKIIYSESDQIMQKNLEEALESNKIRDPNAPWVSDVNQLANASNSPVILISDSVVSLLGNRTANEDTHIWFENDQFILAGVFDGNEGDHVSKFLEKNFLIYFQKELQENPNDINACFNNTAQKLQAEIASKVEKVMPPSPFDQSPGKKPLKIGGSTACVCYIDKTSNFIYTATLADSEAFFYSTNAETTKILPLSTTRNVTYLEERTRIFEDGKELILKVQFEEGVDSAVSVKHVFLNGDPSKRGIYFKYNNVGSKLSFPMYLPLLKQIRIGEEGVNITRGFGLSRFGNAISHEFKVTKTPLTPGTLVLACDGLHDFLPQNDIINIIEQSKPDTVALDLAKASINKQPTVGDNVTVLVLKFGKKE